MAGMLAGVMAAPAVASPPDKFEAPWEFGFPDLENEFAVFINIDRATRCPAEQVDYEHAFLAWLEGGEMGDPPPQPVIADGRGLVSVKAQETGQGALVGHVTGNDLYIEVWHLDSPEYRPFVGPCTDTDDDGSFFATGTTSYKSIDNDVFGSGTRGNSWGDQGKADLTAENGAEYSYKWKFHINSACYAPMDGPPSCLIESWSLTAK
jgi:hypothetical protein